MSNLTLRTKFIVLGIVSLLGVSALAYTGYNAVEDLLKLTKLETVNATVRSQMELDMMHDAIDGDLQKALAAVQAKDLEALKSSSEALVGHRETAAGSIKSLNELDLFPPQ
jgi:ribosome-interacting GTPase 1